MTLIEILTVLAILGLIATVLIVVLLPSDDRRVKGEAERLAAYCTGAAADAKMSEAAIRVALTFEDGTYTRQSANVGAQLGAFNWEADKRAHGDRVKSPVRVVSVQVPEVGPIETGQAWLMWEDTKTRGGVVVLGLNEAFWSVVVDPSNGEVRTEKGKASLPEGRSPLRRSLSAPAYSVLSEDSTMPADQVMSILSQTAANLNNHPPGSAPPPPSDAPSQNTPDAFVPPAENGGTLPPACPGPGCPPPAGTEPPPQAQTPDAATEAPDAGKSVDASIALDQSTPPGNNTCDPACEPKNGVDFTCQEMPDENGSKAHKCVPDLRGKAYLSTRFAPMGILASADASLGIGPVLNMVLNNGYKLFVVFPEAGGAGSLTSFGIDLVQGGNVVSSGTYQGDNLASTDRTGWATWVPATAQESDQEDPLFGVYAITPNKANGQRVQGSGSARGVLGPFRLVVPWGPEGDKCFWSFTTVVNIVAMLVPTSDGKTVLKSVMHTCLGGANLDIKVPVGSGKVELSTLLGSAAPPDCDSNGDGDIDGWTLELAVTFQSVHFADDPGRFDGNLPAPACR